MGKITGSLGGFAAEWKHDSHGGFNVLPFHKNA